MVDPLGVAEWSRGPYLVLYVKTLSEVPSKDAANRLTALQRDFPDLGELKIIEVAPHSIGEPLPFLATHVGVVRGVEQIEYFVDSERRLRAAEVAA